MFKKEQGVLLTVKENREGKKVEVYLFDYGFIKNIVLYYPNSYEPGHSANITIQDDGSMKIGFVDVPRKSRKGFGRIILETLILIAMKNNIKEISGIVDSEDEVHRYEEQIPFYESFGFVYDEINNTIKKEVDLRFAKIKTLFKRKYKISQDY